MKELYDRSITDPSLKELEELAGWYNEKFGNHPVIVGGWATYCYTKGLGSKDIDVVFLESKTMHQTLFAYFSGHGYEEKRRDSFGSEFVKVILAGKRKVDIIIDAVASDRTITFEGKKARLPWSWAMKHSHDHRIGNATIRIPTLELLLTYKLGAVFGRNIQLRTGIETAYYRSKLWKDVYDIVSLAELGIDAGKVEKFLSESGLGEHKGEIMQVIEDNYNEEIGSLLKGASLAKIRKVLTGSEDDSLTTKTRGVFKPSAR
jgi:hypothetical protein